MSEVDENLLTLAKLREVVQGNIERDHRMHPHTGIVTDEADRSVLSFCESLDLENSFAETRLGETVLSKIETDAGTRAVQDELAGVASHLVGITEQDLDGSSISLVVSLLDQLQNGGAPSWVSIAGNPNTGKTNSAFKLIELADRAGGLVEDVPDDLLVVTNAASWSRADHVVTSMHDLMVTLLEHREQPKAVVIDEASTHFDARTNNYEIASQWTPAAKRFAKIGVWTTAVIAHTGKDLHPEAKRLTTLALWKTAKEKAEFYDSWPAESDEPADPLFAGEVQPIEAAQSEYDPDDAAPWSWDLRAELFSNVTDWCGLLNLLQERGPAE
ncbi:hypothetical protein [Halorhabdus salina]|uniref:hypothetical protein n=1 Tax=Halorhabdus salina TaxID=2750670 RepID=UPI0015EEAE5B|nr:hypothetical protein [Halorhabdus salina]